MAKLTLHLRQNIKESLRSRIDERGMLLVSALIITSVLMVIGFTLVSAVSSEYRVASDDVYINNALLAAEAGVEQSVEQLNQDDSFAGYPTAQTLFNDAQQGYGTFTADIAASPDNTNAKIITAIGKVYRYGHTTDPVGTRTVKVTVVGTSSPGFSVHTGPGGLILGGSANITNADVYVNGYIDLNGTAKIGTASNPLNVYVANAQCPHGSNPGATYPTVCTDGTQPITMDFSTAIYGTVCATGQTSTGPNNNIKTGNGGAGLQIGCTAPLVSPPSYDRAAQIAAVTTTKASTDSTVKCTGNATRSWPANLKITGDVTVGNSCKLTINGNVYITGNLSIGGSSNITVADSLGASRPVVLVDGTIDVGGSASMIANSTGTGIEFISFCSKQGASDICHPDIVPTGTALANTQGILTVNVAGSVNLAGMVFDAYWGKVSVGGSGNIGAAAGQTVDLSGAGTVVFGTSLSSGVRTWTISSYQQLPNSS